MTESGSPTAVFRQGVADGAYPGGQLAASKDGHRLVSVAAGYLEAGGPPTDERVIYDLASLTKPLATSVLIGRAIEQQRCALSDPLARFVEGVPEGVTIEHALDHSTGYPAHIRFDQTLPADTAPGSWAAYRHIVRTAASTPLDAPVGQRAVYSDLGFILLGAALEAMHDEPISEVFAGLSTPLFYRDRRGPPAGAPPTPNVPIAPTEACSPGDVHDENCRAMGGAAGHAGLWGTAEGVLEVAESLVAAYHGQPGQLLKPETVRRLWQPSLVDSSTRTPGWDRPSGDNSSTGGRWPPHSVGHLGFTGTSLWIEPDRRLVVVLVTNRVCPSRENNLIRRLRPALHDAAWRAWA